MRLWCVFLGMPSLRPKVLTTFQRDNILFGQPLDEARYWGVVEKACLLPDLQTLPDGDLTEVIFFSAYVHPPSQVFDTR